jgi:hypothetical protein
MKPWDKRNVARPKLRRVVGWSAPAALPAAPGSDRMRPLNRARGGPMAAAPQLKNTSMTEAEWQTRCQLAALYHVVDHLGWTNLINTHFSARVPGEADTFLINRYGLMFDEITASSLIKMDFAGNVIGDDAAFNDAGFTIHSGVYKARHDANCVTHTIPAPAPPCRCWTRASGRSARIRCTSTTTSPITPTACRRRWRSAKPWAAPAKTAAASY